jgi:type VI secretion system protein ImpM
MSGGSFDASLDVVQVGLFGKLPSHGDFLRRRASDAFVDAWDAWLRDCLTESQAALGERWLDVYLTSPAWRFVGASGVCGPTPVIGVMVPSVDRVGRYFPLTLVAELPDDVSLIAAVIGSPRFFERAEGLLIETLAADEIDFESFDEQVAKLRDSLETAIQPPPVVLDPGAAAVVGDGPHAWQIPIGPNAQTLAAVFGQLLTQRLSAVYGSFAVWWTEGSSIVEPSCLIARGLPDPSSFGALLDGDWGRFQWRSVPARIDTGDTIELKMETPPARVSFRSAAASDIGLSREINEDAFVERPDAGIWAVADGLGGHRAGEVASHMVCDALADLVPDATFDGTIAAARQRLQAVNEHLLRTSTRVTLVDRSASTVVVLLVRDVECAILWAGDSRVYRWRSGRLERLTRDHSVEDVEELERRELANAVTRAVGVQPMLSLDLLRDTVSPGDRFVLCSDGLTRTLSEAQIAAQIAATPDIRQAVDALIGDTLAAGAPDNVTVLMVEGYSAGT